MADHYTMSKQAVVGAGRRLYRSSCCALLVGASLEEPNRRRVGFGLLHRACSLGISDAFARWTKDVSSPSHANMKKIEGGLGRSMSVVRPFLGAPCTSFSLAHCSMRNAWTSLLVCVSFFAHVVFFGFVVVCGGSSATLRRASCTLISKSQQRHIQGRSSMTCQGVHQQRQTRAHVSLNRRNTARDPVRVESVDRKTTVFTNSLETRHQNKIQQQTNTKLSCAFFPAIFRPTSLDTEHGNYQSDSCHEFAAMLAFLVVQYHPTNAALLDVSRVT